MHEILRLSLIFVFLIPGLNFSGNDENQKDIPLEVQDKSVTRPQQISEKNRFVTPLRTVPAINNNTASKVPKPDDNIEPLEQVFIADPALNENLTIAKDAIAKSDKQFENAPEDGEKPKNELSEETAHLLIKQSANEQTESSDSIEVAAEEALERWAVEKSDTVQIGQQDNNTLTIKEEDVIDAANEGLQAMNDLYYIKEPSLYMKGLFLDADNPARYVAAFNSETEEAGKLARFGYASIEAAKAFRRKFPEISRQNSHIPISRNSDLHKQCPKRGIPQCKPASLRYRTADGSCNNPKQLWWGSSMSPMQRFLPAVYQDGIESIRLSITGSLLPSPRDISNFIHEDKDIQLASVTHMLMQWGQFIDHDITATGQSRGFNGTVPQCCSRRGADFQPLELMHPECLPISVSPADTFYGRLGIKCLEFVRSTLAPKEGCEFGSRDQINQVTSYIDASTVYASNARLSDSLRLKRNGLLQYGRVQARMPILPRDKPDLCRLSTVSTTCFKAGDGRLGEQPGLTSMHIVFLRLHNRIATQLSGLNPRWNDEKLFQETRKIVGAIVQHITYREFLPIVLGPDVMKNFDLEILKSGYYMGYDPNINPDIANEFSSAAYRFGHSLVQKSFVRFDKSHRPILNNLTIHEEFGNPNLVTAGALDKIILGLINQPSQRRDEFIVSELTNHLFQTRSFAFGMDLASLNIQRGRDHGIPPYVQWQNICDLSPIKTWQDFEAVTSPGVMNKFRTLYSALEDIDLFPAGLAEKPLKGGLVGPTLACIIAQQFSNLRRGDRFWFENPHADNKFTLPQLNQIRKITLAQVLCRTMDNVDSVQPFVMLTADNRRNQRKSCLDRAGSGFRLDPWIEIEPDVFKDDPVTEPGFTEEEQQIIDDEAQSRTPAKGVFGNKKLHNPFAKPTMSQRPRLPPMRHRPLKTQVNQQNRITVKRPLGPGENVTIYVQNNAVNAPIFVNNAHITGSHININQGSTTTQEPDVETNVPPPQVQKPQYPICSTCQYYPTIPKPIAKPQGDGSTPYIPYNFNDPSNPNPPHYGYSASPPNNYVPNNFYFYSLMKPHHFYNPALVQERPQEYPPNFASQFFQHPGGFSEPWMEKEEEASQNRYNGWINVTSTGDQITIQENGKEDKVDETSPAGELEDFSTESGDLQSPKYRLDALWDEKKSMIEELIQHTNLPLNPVGVIESHKRTDAEDLSVNQRVVVKVDEDSEKRYKWNTDEGKPVKGVFYFDKSVLREYPEGGVEPTAEVPLHGDFADQVLGGECLNKTCAGKEEHEGQGEFEGPKAQNPRTKTVQEEEGEAIMEDELIAQAAEFEKSRNGSMEEVYPEDKEMVENRLSSEPGDDFDQMPSIISDQIATASELPKPMKLHLYL